MNLRTTPLLALAFALAPTPSAAETLLSVDFDDHPAGAYTASDVLADWGTTNVQNGVNQGRTQISLDAAAHAGGSLVVDYPAGTFGPSPGGAQWLVTLPSAHDELYLAYWVRFGTGFDFVKGGKLPGLAGGAANTGGEPPNGTDGWSARMMWRTSGAAVQYMYYPDQASIYGDDFDYELGGQRYFVPGQWHRVIHRVVMNTPGANDGVMQAWFDGNLVVNRADLRYRDVASLRIDKFYFSTFFGGGDSSWSCTADEEVWFDDFVISTDPPSDTPVDPVDPPDPPTGNLIANGDFALGDASWALQTAGTGVATGSGATGEFVFDVASAGTEYFHVQLLQSGIPLVAGQTYTLSFTVRSTEPQPIRLFLGRNGDPWDHYMDLEATATATAQQLTHTFVASTTDAAARFGIQVGTASGQLVFDDVSLVVGATPPPPSDGTGGGSGVTPTPTGTAPAPTGTAPAPTGTAPAPTGTAPAPTGTAPAPTTTAPAPTTGGGATGGGAATFAPGDGGGCTFQPTSGGSLLGLALAALLAAARRRRTGGHGLNG